MAPLSSYIWRKVLCLAVLNAAAWAAGAQPVASPRSQGAGQTDSKQHARLQLAFVANNASDYWTLARRGVERAERELGRVQVRFLLPPMGTPENQAEIARTLLAQGVQGVVICPVDARNQTVLLNELASKTVLLTADADAPQSQRRAFVGTDNYQAGFKAGRLLRDALPRGGQVAAFVGSRDAFNASERERGARAALRGSRVRLVKVFVDDADRSKAVANVGTALVRYPRLAAMLGFWSYNGPAILQGLTAARKIGKVKIVCFDDEDETLAGVARGAIYATVVQQPEQIGYRSVLLLTRLLENRATLPAHARLDVPTLIVRHRTVRAYRARLRRLQLSPGQSF